MMAAGPRVPATTHRRNVLIAVAGGALLIAFNVAVYLAPIDYGALTSFAYLGAFVITFLANALVAIPIPYIPIIAHIGATADSAAIVVALGALGSVLGDPSRSSSAARSRASSPSIRCIGVSIASPIGNGSQASCCRARGAAQPLFDVAGLIAGAIGMRYRVFFLAVFTARMLRLAGSSGSGR